MNILASRIGLFYEDHHLFDKAISLYHTMLERDNSIEEFYLGLMRCALIVGNYAEGLRVYNQCSQILNNKFRVGPGKNTEIMRSKLQEWV